MFLFLHLDAYSNPTLTQGSLLLPLPRTNTGEPPSHTFCLLNLFSTSLSTITYLARGLKSKLQLRLSEGPSRARFPYPGSFFSADTAGQTHQPRSTINKEPAGARSSREKCTHGLSPNSSTISPSYPAAPGRPGPGLCCEAPRGEGWEEAPCLAPAATHAPLSPTSPPERWPLKRTRSQSHLLPASKKRRKAFLSCGAA